MPEHLESCALLWHAAQHEMLPGTSARPRQAFFGETEGENILVALHGDEPMGFATLWRPPAFIHFLIVSALYRRRGVGSLLLRAAVAELGRPVELKCDPRNLTAREFYEKRGWQTVECNTDAMPPFIRYRLS